MSYKEALAYPIPAPLEDSMVEGYLDGFGDSRSEYPATLSNRDACYRHGWLNGCADRLNYSRPDAEESFFAAIREDGGSIH